MLQIISGKFFKSNELYISEGKGILFSNYSWINTINTSVVNIEPVQTHCSVSSYIISYKNQIEKTSILVRTGDYEILMQTKLLSSFGLKAFFDIDKNLIQLLCRDKKMHEGDSVLPSILTRRFLDNSIIGSQQEVDNFTSFIDKVISLKRDTYKTVILCISAFETALKTLDQDINLAYSLLIYSLETLCQNFDDYNATWDDFDQNQRIKLDEVFDSINPEQVLLIKNILLKDKHIKLTKRFVSFINKYITNNFFIADAEQIPSAIKRTELNQLLINAYNMRSAYVHNLKPIIKQLTIPEIVRGDIFTWEGQPYLTFSGLCRLTHHILDNFIMQQPSVEKEDYNWSNDLPGLITLRLDPQYWIWKHENTIQEHATVKYEALLEQFATDSITDIRPLLKKYEELIPQSINPYKIQMLSMYLLVNHHISEEYKIKGFDDFLKLYNEDFNSCCIETILDGILLNIKLPWKSEECEGVLAKYLNNRFKKKRVKNLILPKIYEIAIFITIANLYLSEGNFEKQKNWLETALFDSPGQVGIQNEIKNAIKNKTYIDVLNLLFKKYMKS